MPIADIGREAAEASTGNDAQEEESGNDYDRIDVSDASYIKLHPGATAIEATVEGLRYFAPYDENGEYQEDGRGEVHVVASDVTIPDDEDLDDVAIFEGTGGGDDYKVVNTASDNVDVYDAGVSVGEMYEADEVDEFDIDGRAVIKLSTSAGRSVARTLDVNGLPNADVVRTDDGAVELQENGWPTDNGALVEKHPRNREDDFYEPARYARDPQLRPEVEGERIVLLVQEMSEVIDDYTGNSHWATVLADLDEDTQDELVEQYIEDDFYTGDSEDDFIDTVNGTEYVNLAPTSDGEPDEDLVIATGYLKWNWPTDSELEQLREDQGVSP